MDLETKLEPLFRACTDGDRAAARQIVDEALEAGISSEDVTMYLFWPVLDQVNTAYREDRIETLAHHYSTRLLRMLIDQSQARYAQKSRKNRRVLLFTGPAEGDELCGHLVSDLIEADGYEIFFCGGGIANDEILSEVGRLRPDTLLMYASAASDAPNIRQLIDQIRNHNTCPNMQVVVGAGVFARAQGLAAEIGADAWADSPDRLLHTLEHEHDRRATPEQRTVGNKRKKAPENVQERKAA